MLDWLVVGGGIHGVHLAVRLLGDLRVRPSALRIVDPGDKLLATWFRCTASTGMTHLRSPAVHHLDRDPYSLLRFAGGGGVAGRRRGLFAAPYDRPSLPLFAEHSAWVIEQYALSDLHHRGRVVDVRLSGKQAVATLDDGTQLAARQVLLALGATDRLRWPAWAARLKAEGAPVQHLFAPDFALPQVERVAVIGGGISSAQVALRLERAGAEVHWVSHHPPRVAQFDSDPGWIGPRYMRGFSQESCPDARRERIIAARHRGSMPPDVHRELTRALDAGRIRWVQGAVAGAHGGPPLRLVVGDELSEVDAVVLATGMSTQRPGGSLVDGLVRRHDLRCAACGYPIVDEKLRWHPRLVVSGPLAELELGPVSRNIIGARRAGERLIAS